MSWEFLERLPGNSEIIFTRVLTSELILDQPAFVATKPDENIEPSESNPPHWFYGSNQGEDIDIFNRYYLELGNPNPLSGIV